MIPFILILLGSVLAELINYRHKAKVNIVRLFANATIFTVVTCAVISVSQIQISFEVYVAICVVLGYISWKFKLVQVIFDKQFLMSILSKILSTCSKPIAKAASVALDELEEQEKKNNKKKPKRTSTKPKTASNNNSTKKDNTTAN